MTTDILLGLVCGSISVWFIQFGVRIFCSRKYFLKNFEEKEFSLLNYEYNRFWKPGPLIVIGFSLLPVALLPYTTDYFVLYQQVMLITIGSLALIFASSFIFSVKFRSFFGKMYGIWEQSLKIQVSPSEDQL